MASATCRAQFEHVMPLMASSVPAAGAVRAWGCGARSVACSVCIVHWLHRVYSNRGRCLTQSGSGGMWGGTPCQSPLEAAIQSRQLVLFPPDRSAPRGQGQARGEPAAGVV